MSRLSYPVINNKEDVKERKKAPKNLHYSLDASGFGHNLLEIYFYLFIFRTDDTQFTVPSFSLKKKKYFFLKEVFNNCRIMGI